MNAEVLTTFAVWGGIVLAVWLVLSVLLAALVGKGIHMADERQPHPAPESVEDAA